MSSTTGADPSAGYNQPQPYCAAEDQRRDPSPEKSPPFWRIVLTALSGGVALVSAVGSYYYGLEGVRDQHPWYLVLG